MNIRSIRSNRARYMILVVTCLALGASVVPLAQQPASAYDVCSDDEAPCVHEYMAAVAMSTVFNTAEILDHADDILAGATHEDELDHVYGLSGIEGSLVTITHFWDSDKGPNDPVENIFGSFPNAWQKTQALWSLALGAYAKGDREQAYHWLGHVAHMIGDSTIPTHVHDDMHGPDFYDDDAYEEWMSVPSNTPGLPANAQVSSAEAEILLAQGPIPVPDNVADKLHYLLYTTNQVADFFASEGGITEFGSYDGDTVDPLGFALVQAELNQMAATITSPRTSDQLDDNDDDNDNEDGDLGRIRQHSYLRGIRSIGAMYKLFSETVTQQISLAVVVDHVEEDEDHDYASGVETSDPDFYARVSVAGLPAQNRGDEVVDDEVIDPGWAFGNSVGVSGSVPVHLEIWDNDGDEDDANPFGGGDDQSDIDPDAEDDDQTLDLNVDLAKCLTRAAGAITGDASGTCGDTLISTGDDDDEASQVRFHVIMSKSPPTAEARGPYTTDEGTDITLDGTGSSDPDNDITTYAWDLDGDGACDDVANDPTPDFTAVGQDGVTTVKLCVTDAVGLTAEDTATVTVRNVTPTIGLAAISPVGENTSLTITGTLTDPGWLDSLSGTISWGDGSPAQPLSGTGENTRPDATLSFGASHIYGDNGTFTAQVCAADDDTNPCTTIPLTVDNTSPTTTIDLSRAILVNGVPTIIGHADSLVAFDGRSTDPGSDDLTLAWAWGDGTSEASTTSLVNPPNADQPLSPSIQPRDVTFPQTHIFGAACTYQTSFTSTDDDGGSTVTAANVIIVGNNHPNRPHGYWKQQFRHYVDGRGPSDFDATTLNCYLKVVDYMSPVFAFTDPTAGNFAKAYDVLDTSGTSAMTELFDQQLLAAWLNFANGAIEHDRLVDTNGDKVADTPFLIAIAAAESLRLDPSSTREQLDRQKVILESWTNMP